MDKPDIRLIDVLADVEYERFDEDPDGDPDRAGDGWYYRVPGDGDWHGPWLSNAEAVEEATDLLHAMQRAAVLAELADAGYVRMGEIQGHSLFARAVDDVYAVVQVSARKLLATVATADRGGELVRSEEFDGKQRFGAIQMAVRGAIEALEEEVGPAPSSPAP